MLVIWAIPVLIGSLIFLYVGRTISIVDKHIFYAIPVLLIGTAVVFERLWDARRAARLPVLAFYGYLTIAALQLWIGRIASIRQ